MDTTRRDVLKLGGAAMASAVMGNASPGPAPLDSEEEFRVQRLTWAGIKVVYKKTTIFLDPLTNAEVWDGAWKGPLPVETDRRHVLLTHLHNDHFDPIAIKSIAAPSQFFVGCHESKAATVASKGFVVYPFSLYAPVTVGGLTVCAVPAVDGFNEYQVSWVITGGGKRIIHCGDTLWHGGFWHIGEQYGPFDAAFLPINGAKLLGRQPFSDVEATMTPAHAIAASVVMRAKLVIPIHHGMNDPTSYLEHPNAVGEFTSIAEKRKQACKVMSPGEWLTL